MRVPGNWLGLMFKTLFGVRLFLRMAGAIVMATVVKFKAIRHVALTLTSRPSILPGMNGNELFFDLYTQYVHNPTFQARAEREMKLLQLADREGRIDARAEHMRNLLRMCDYNASLFIPYYFPNFSRGEAMRLWRRPHAVAMMSMVPSGTCCIEAGRQVGKCVAGDTKLDIRDEWGDGEELTIQELFNRTKRECV